MEEEPKVKGFPCRRCRSTKTIFVKEQFDENGNKLGELWTCNKCQKDFRVSPEEKFKGQRND